jgi:hypothetical protein
MAAYQPFDADNDPPTINGVFGAKLFKKMLEKLRANPRGEHLDILKDTLRISARIHCECYLLAYHFRNKNLFPYDYIGVPKLSCHGCRVYFEAFGRACADGQITGTIFHTSGSHNKIYPHWQHPTLQPRQGTLRIQVPYQTPIL